MKILEDGTYVFENPVEEAEHQPASNPKACLPWEVQACHFYVETGNISATARKFSTSLYHIKRLMEKPWWQELEQELNQQHRVRSEAGFSKIVEKSLSILEDRLDNGDIIRFEEDKETGATVAVRAPIKAVEVAKIADMAFMKRQLIRNEPTVIPGSTETLTILARKLQALGAKDPALLEANDEVVRKEKRRRQVIPAVGRIIEEDGDDTASSD